MASSPRPDAWRSTVKIRLGVLAALFLCWGAVIQARLVWLQVYERDELVARAARQQMRTITVPAVRGDIYDRNGRVLATSIDAPTIYAVPSEISDPAATVASLCRVLEDCPSRFREDLVERFTRGGAFAYVKRQVSPAEARAVMALKLDGIALSAESRRYYPNRELLAPTLGFVGVDNDGLGGIEMRWNDVIRGKDGKRQVFTDARRHAYDRIERPPTSGASIELTVDAVLQHIVERELDRGIAENRADGGVAIVMDPSSGEILAIASEPGFNPNDFANADPNGRRNRAVQDIYEPGSTFKTVTASAAFEENVIRPETPINCAPGHINIGARRVRDVHAYGTLTFADVIVKSSNVGAIKAGFRVGGERMSRYVRRFGFGTRLSRDLPSEQSGIVWSRLNDSGLASVSMGYQVSVTPLQMVTAVSSIANGGQLMRPRIVGAVIREGVRHPIEPEVMRRTVSRDTAATLTGIMEEVVERGTAKAARIEGYRIAGKTGTSAKLEDGRYSKTQYMASFVGFLPSRAPAVAILVVIDTPRAGTYYGGSVAAPVFKRIADATIRHLGLPRSVDPEPPVIVKSTSTSPLQAVKYGSGPVVVTPAADARRRGVMPDLTGLGARTAVRRLAEVGIVAELLGSGLVVDQQPGAGNALQPGQRVTLRLDRTPPLGEEPPPGR